MSPYRVGDYQEPSIYDLPPPPPPPEMPPLPNAAYSFRGGDSWRPDNNHASSQNNEFSFRNNRDAPQYLREHDRAVSPRYYGNQGRSHQHSEKRDRYRQGSNYGTSAQRGNYNGVQRGNRRVATAARPLLSLKQGDSPVLMLGTVDGSDVGMRFLPANDMSDSDEEQMDVSESDQDQVDGENANLMEMATGSGIDNETEIDIEPPAKKRALGTMRNVSANEASIPKWSNPDPYTSLPPTDDSLRKKKDVVKIIRKARIATSKSTNTTSQVAANDDFISFGFEEESTLKVASNLPLSPVIKGDEEGIGAPNAPSGPRQFNHLQTLHENFSRAPGTQDLPLVADKLGPPPGLNYADDTMNDSPLGNRKRTHDDVIKSSLERPAIRKKGFLGTSNGSLIEEWIPRNGTDSTPWHDPRRTYQTENMGFRLHKEICDFYEFVRPQKFEQRVREDLLDRLQNAVEQNFQNCRVYCFGSFAAGLYLPNADMDVVIISEEYRTLGHKVICQSNSSMRRFGSYLQISQIAEEDSIEVIAGAKVPLIKFVDRETAIRVDVSFENQTGLIANDTFNTWKSRFPAMPILVTLIKQFLMMRGLNEVVNGGLGGFSVTCLVTSLLQNMPRVQIGEFVPEQHLGEILIEFLDFYGNQLDITRTGIRMNPPGYFDKHAYARNMSNKQVYQTARVDRLAILDPNLPDNDISGGSRNIMVIIDCISRAHLDLIRAMRSPTQRSLLESVLGGNYNSFLWQRNHLHQLHRVKWGNPAPDMIDFRDNNRIQLQNHSNSNGQSQLPSQGLVNGFQQEHYATSYFVNPVNPGVQISNPTKRAKKSSSTGQHPRIKTRLSFKEKSKIRAARLKEEYPTMQNIPHSITSTARLALIAKHTAKQLKLDRKPKHKAIENSSNTVAQKGRHISPEVSDARRAEIERNLGGITPDDPITID